jgi:hypothetical protein
MELHFGVRLNEIVEVQLHDIATVAPAFRRWGDTALGKFEPET